MKKHFLLIALLAMALLCPSIKAEAQDQTGDNPQTTLYGCCLYSETGTMPMGIYSFPATENTSFTPLWVNGDLMANGGATYANGLYYIFTYLDFGGMGVASLLTCDVESQEIIATADIPMYDYNISYISTDMAYDPTTGRIYCCSFNADGSGSFVLSTLDVETGGKDAIAPMQQMCALAVDAAGQLYGIGADDGVLYKINKADATLSPVGSTGLAPTGSQSATIDSETGTFYWSAYTADGGALYTVDTATGAATMISEFPDKAQITGLYTKRTENKAPSVPTDVMLDFEKDNLSGSISFVIPDTDADGNPLADATLDYEVRIDDAAYATGQGIPGETTEVPITVEAAGNYYFSVSVANSAGSSSAAGMTKYIGMDTPCAITDITVAASDEETVTINWTLPERGVNGGYIDPQQVTYEIVRMPEEETLPEVTGSSSYSDTPDAEEIRICYYTITPHIGNLIGEPTITEYAIMGDHLNIPVDENLADWTRFPLFTVVDVNDDFSTWIYDLESGTVKYQWAFGDANNDWFITPSVKLEQGKSYRVTGYFRSSRQEYAGYIAYYIGNGNTPDDLATSIMTPTEINSTTTQECVSGNFSVDESGMYNIGIHVSGESNTCYIYFDRLVIEEVEDSGVAHATSSASSPISISNDGQMVTITNPECHTVNIYTAAGLLYVSSNDPSITLAPQHGVYIITAGSYTTKVIF